MSRLPLLFFLLLLVYSNTGQCQFLDSLPAIPARYFSKVQSSLHLAESKISKANVILLQRMQKQEESAVRMLKGMDSALADSGVVMGFLSYRQIPRTQALTFRRGRCFNVCGFAAGVRRVCTMLHC